MFDWIDFLTYVLITAATPGPNTLLSMSTAARMGLRRSYPLNLGIWAGFSIVSVGCVIFCSILGSLVHTMQTPMKVIGACYMLYLAWKSLKRSGDLNQQSAKSGFRAGFTLQFLNPKVYLYCIVSMEVYVLPYFQSQPLILLGFALLLSTIAFFLGLLWGTFGDVFRLLFSRHAKATNTVMALLLVYCAVSLFL